MSGLGRDEERAMRALAEHQRKLKWPILCLTHRRSTSAPPWSRPNPRLSRALQDFTKLVVHLKTEIRGKYAEVSSVDTRL